MQSFMMQVGISIAMLIAIGVPAWAQDETEAAAAEPAVEAVTDYQADVSAETAVAAAEVPEVWWGNRSVSYRNYIPIEAPDCQGECKYCDKNMICCRTGCPCTTCEYICDDCHDCPPAYFDKIFFDLDKAVLRPDGVVECDKVLEYLRMHPEKSVQIEGHCCDLATDDYNIDLGRRRAESVRAYLMQNGISADRISTETYGERRPWVGAEQRELNRRAVVIPLPDGTK